MAGTEIVWDRRQQYVLQQTTIDRFELIIDRYMKFCANLKDPNKENVRVFDKLSPKQLQELELIREVSKTLQMKKEEDMKKQAANEETKTDAEPSAEPAESVEEKLEK